MVSRYTDLFDLSVFLCVGRAGFTCSVFELEGQRGWFELNVVV